MHVLTRASANTWDEQYTLPKISILAYQRAQERVIVSLRVASCRMTPSFGPLSEGQNILPGKHAYSHVNALCSPCNLFRRRSDMHFRAAQKDSSLCGAELCHGGWGPDESFRQPGDQQLAKTLESFPS